MTWVLIVWIHVGYSTAMTTAEFHSEEACNTAGAKAVKSTTNLFSSGGWVCAEK